MYLKDPGASGSQVKGALVVFQKLRAEGGSKAAGKLDGNDVSLVTVTGHRLLLLLGLLLGGWGVAGLGTQT